jgi:hypothetical protein
VHQRLPDHVEKGASEGAAFRAVAQSSRRTPAAIALAAIGVLAFALLTRQPAPPPSVPTAGVAPLPPPAEAVTSPVGPVVAPAASPTSGAPTRNPTVTPHPRFFAVQVEAGATELIPAGPTPVRLAISLPDGWAKASDAMYVKANGVAPAGISIGAWHLQHVNVFPCRWATNAFADGPLMRSAEGQAQALSGWWGQDPGAGPYGNSGLAPIASKREPTTIGGYSAWYVEVLIPSYLDQAECDGGQVVLWDTASGDVRYGLGSRELNRLWVVDVQGEIIVIDAASFLPTPEADVTELQAVIDSVIIEP